MPSISVPTISFLTEIFNVANKVHCCTKNGYMAIKIREMICPQYFYNKF